MMIKINEETMHKALQRIEHWSEDLGESIRSVTITPCYGGYKAVIIYEK